MSSLKNIHSSIFIGIFLLFTSCQNAPESTKSFPTIDLSATPLFYYTQVGSIEHPPLAFYESWNRSALKSLGIKQIELYSKGGKNPDDTLYRIVFRYDNNWQHLKFSAFNYEESKEPVTLGSVHLGKDKGLISFPFYFGTDRDLKTDILPSKDGTLFLRRKQGNKSDTTWLIGMASDPKAIISKIGNSVFSVDLYLPDGSSKSDIVQRFNELPGITKTALITAQCSVTFTESGRPQRTFLLNEQFSQVAKIREWNYADNGNIAAYKEWTGDAQTLDMQWHYSNSQLPDYTVIDRNTYFYRYE